LQGCKWSKECCQFLVNGITAKQYISSIIQKLILGSQIQPWRYLKWIVNWMLGRASWVLLQTQLAHWINPDWAWSMEQEQAVYDDYDEENNKSSAPGTFK